MWFSSGFGVFNDGVIKGALSAPHESDGWKTFVLVTYCAVLAVLWFFGMHRYAIMRWFKKLKSSPPVPPRQFSEAELPRVTVQLAVFNEMYVVKRLIDAVCALDYPRDRLDIQLLDDSTDETKAIAAARVDHWRERGFDIHHVHRTDRTGFKAGALEAGLETAKGDFIVMFDADFVPPKDFIRRQIHHFTDEKIGFVQARWGHLNEDHSMLTRLQAIFLNGHFVLEHTARQRTDRFFTFSGTAGTWRRATIAGAGGWQHDTLVEDCDLSYRAQLAGWRGVYLVDQAVPAELPVDMNGFKSQQHRWAKGFIQVMKKLLVRVWRSDEPLKVKVEATFHLTNNLTYPLMVMLSVLMLPALHYRASLESDWVAVAFDLSLFFGATVSVIAFYLYAQRQIDETWPKKLRYMPLLLGLGIGLCLNQSKAVFEALFNQVSPFVRTPKYSVDGKDRSDGWMRKKYKASQSLMPFAELLFAAYFAVVTGYALWQKLWLAVPFLGLFFWGFGYVGYKSLVVGGPRRAEVSVPAPANA